MKKCYIVLIGIALIGCNGQSFQKNSLQKTNDPIEKVKEKETIAQEKQYDNLGELISKIAFNVKTNNKEDFENGIIPWASIANFKEDITNLIDKDEIVLIQPSIKIIIDYPLTNQYEFSLTSENGFTRKQLLTEISKHYYKLYEEEEKSATIKTIPVEKRTQMYNRNETNGKYGIWGHDIADLVLAEILIFKTAEGKIVLTLNIES